MSEGAAASRRSCRNWERSIHRRMSPPIGVDIPLSPLEKEANRETALGALFWHLGQEAPSPDCEKDRISSNLISQLGQQYS